MFSSLSSSSLQNSDSCKPAGRVGWNQRWFCWRLSHFPLTWIHRSAWASVSCQRRAPWSEINAFIFYSGNNFDEICFTQWCLNQSANQGHWAGCRSVTEMMEKTSDQEKSKCGCVASQEENKFILAADDDLKISFWYRVTCVFGRRPPSVLHDKHTIAFKYLF